MQEIFKNIRRFEEIGMDKEQALQHTKIILDLVQAHTISKEEFNATHLSIDSKFKSIDAEFKRIDSEFKNVRAEMRAEFQNVRTEMRLGFKNLETKIQNMPNIFVIRMTIVLAIMEALKKYI